MSINTHWKKITQYANNTTKTELIMDNAKHIEQQKLSSSGLKYIPEEDKWIDTKNGINIRYIDMGDF
jgi:hypothetical protein